MVLKAQNYAVNRAIAQIIMCLQNFPKIVLGVP